MVHSADLLNLHNSHTVRSVSAMVWIVAYSTVTSDSMSWGSTVSVPVEQ